MSNPESCQIQHKIIRDIQMHYKAHLVHCYLPSAGNGTAEQQKWPIFVCDYNICMGGSDLKDWMLKS